MKNMYVNPGKKPKKKIKEAVERMEKQTRSRVSVKNVEPKEKLYHKR